MNLSKQQVDLKFLVYESAKKNSKRAKPGIMRMGRKILG